MELLCGAEDCLFVELLCGAWVELLCGASLSSSVSDSCELELTERIGDLDIHTSVRCLATPMAGQPAIGKPNKCFANPDG